MQLLTATRTFLLQILRTATLLFDSWSKCGQPAVPYSDACRVLVQCNNSSRWDADCLAGLPMQLCTRKKVKVLAAARSYHQDFGLKILLKTLPIFWVTVCAVVPLGGVSGLATGGGIAPPSPGYARERNCAVVDSGAVACSPALPNDSPCALSTCVDPSPGLRLVLPCPSFRDQASCFASATASPWCDVGARWDSMPDWVCVGSPWVG